MNLQDNNARDGNRTPVASCGFDYPKDEPEARDTDARSESEILLRVLDMLCDNDLSPKAVGQVAITVRHMIRNSGGNLDELARRLKVKKSRASKLGNAVTAIFPNVLAGKRTRVSAARKLPAHR